MIGISGATAAGKTTAATTLRERGFAYARYSEVLATMLREQGGQVDRHALQELGEAVHREPGQRWLSAQLLSRLPNDATLIVVDGLRFPDDHAFFAERYGPSFVHLHVVAPEDARKDRYVAMGFTEADFDNVAAHPVERGIPALARLANFRLDNSGTLKTFRLRVLEAAAPLEQRALA